MLLNIMPGTEVMNQSFRHPMGGTVVVSPNGETIEGIVWVKWCNGKITEEELGDITLTGYVVVAENESKTIGKPRPLTERAEAVRLKRYELSEKNSWDITVAALKDHFLQGNSQIANVHEFIERRTIETIQDIIDTETDTATMVKERPRLRVAESRDDLPESPSCRTFTNTD
jgi:hypothetical protein